MTDSSGRPTATSTAPSARVALAGLHLHALGLKECVDLVLAWLGEATPRRVATANLDFFALADRDAELRAALESADLVTCDGMPVFVALRLLGVPIGERVAGVDLVELVLAGAAEHGRSVFLLGGPPGVAELAAAAAQRRHPKLRVVGARAPDVDLADPASGRAAAALVRASGCDLALVAFGCPKQELFLARHLDELGCRVAIGVGGTFAFLAGVKRRAPRFVRAAGLEWLHRLAQEPLRLGGRYARDLRYLVARFLPAVMAQRRAGR